MSQPGQITADRERGHPEDLQRQNVGFNVEATFQPTILRENTILREKTSATNATYANPAQERTQAA